MVTLHNLSAEPAKVRLPDDPDEATEDQSMRQVLGDADPPYIPGQDIILGRYGFRWLRRLD
jgi:hypothetical protein